MNLLLMCFLSILGAADRLDIAPAPGPQKLYQFRKQLKTPNLDKLMLNHEISALRLRVYERSDKSIDAYMRGPWNLYQLQKQVKSGEIAKDELSPKLLNALDIK